LTGRRWQSAIIGTHGFQLAGNREAFVMEKLLSISEKAAWQDEVHARVFDEVSAYPHFLMRKRFESFNEVRLLRQHVDAIHGRDLFEIGCATGEFGRYVTKYLPRFNYTGFDISRPAIARAVAKYGSARYRLFETPVSAFREQFGTANVVFCRDVVLHQLDPLGFISSLLQIATEALVLRLRTRDVGETVFDAERSCQYHYDRHWVPYIVLNTKQLIDRICMDPSVTRIVVSRRYEALGGHNFRHLPKELFYSETRTAETALIVLKQETARSGKPKVTYDDRPDGPRYSLMERAILKLARMRVHS
jgi:SAM-dependent methyltransferase